MTKRPIDYTTQMQATEERRRLQEQKQREEALREKVLRDRQAQSYGEVVREIFGHGITIDALVGLLLDAQVRLKADPALKAEWATRGEAYFRPATAKPRPSGQSSKATGGNGNAPANVPPLVPPGAGAAPASGATDLLDGLAKDLPGQSTPPESGGNDGEP